MSTSTSSGGGSSRLTPHPVMKEILEETYGVMVYQEQVMRILNRLGGIELSQAYACIKAISKKKMEVIAQGRKQFADGAVSQGLDRKKADEIFGLIEFFGGYGFNKSHTCAYALVAYQTAWLKTHYPAEFMAALLSSEMDGAERDKYFVDHIDDCRRMGLEVRQPNINVGECDFSVSEDRRHRVRPRRHQGGRHQGGRGDRPRAQGQRPVPRPRRLLRADLHHRRRPGGRRDPDQGRRLRLPGGQTKPARRHPPPRRAGRPGDAARCSRTRSRGTMFGTCSTRPRPAAVPEPDASTIPLPDIEEFPDVQRLADEKKALGFYMTSHPLTTHAELLQALSTHQVADLANVAEKAEITLGGTDRRARRSRTSRRAVTA